MSNSSWMVGGLILFLYIVHKVSLSIMRRPKLVIFDEIKFKTGDILFSRFNYMKEFNIVAHFIMGLMGTILTSAAETHSGFIVVDNDRPFIYHTVGETAYDHMSQTYITRKAGLEDLRDYIARYPGECVIYQLDSIEKQKQMTTKALKYIEETLHKPLGNILNFFYILTKIYTKKNPNNAICSELTAELITRTGIHRIDDTHLKSPGDVRRAIVESKKYKNPILIHNVHMQSVIASI